MIIFLGIVLLWCTIPIVRSLQCDDNFPDALDVGIYWAYNSGLSLAWEKSCFQNISSAFDPMKPTAIFVHGLQTDYVVDDLRFLINDDLKTPYVYAWLANGFNVGVFEWTAFADEALQDFELAEDKIHTTGGFGKMRYRTRGQKRAKVQFSTSDMTVTDHLVAAFRAHYPTGMTSYNPEIRLVGHSLGAQLVTVAAYTMYSRDNDNIKPNRVEMLDLVTSRKDKEYFVNKNECGRNVGDVLGCYVEALTVDHGVAVAAYKYSFLGRCLFSAKEDNDLIEDSMFTVSIVHSFGTHPLGSCWTDDMFKHPTKIKDEIEDMAYQVLYQHVIAVNIYMWSLTSPPHICDLNEDLSCTRLTSIGPSAAMDTAVVRAYATNTLGPGNDKLCFHQYDDCDVKHQGLPLEDIVFFADNSTASTMTIDPSDDLFFLKTCNYAHT